VGAADEVIMFHRAPRLVRVFAYLLMAGLTLHIAQGPVGVDFGIPAAVFDDWIYNFVLVGSACVCLARAVLVREERVAWALIGVGLIAWCAADLYYTAVLSKLDEPPYPSISDLGWLVFYPASWIAVVLLMHRRIREFHASLWLDGLVAALGMAACVAALILPPIVAMSLQGDTAAVAVNLAYPTADMLLLALLLGALALTGWRPDRSIALLGIGVILTAIADISYLDAVAHGQYEAPVWASSLWPASALVTALAAWQRVGTARPVRLEGRRLLVLPLVAMTAALGLLVVDHFDQISDLAAALAFATLLVAGMRLWLTLGEHMKLLGTSRGEATTDALTGLRNRRALVNDLDERVVDASPQRPLLLLLFDLNGFKTYNDTYGHPAGDALLSRLGHALARAVDGRGHAYRMGGDEFCVLAAAPEDQHAEVTGLTRAALSEYGDGFEITTAVGSATIDAPDSDWADALRNADRRMYAEKNSRRASAGGQSAAVLLRVLTERHPDLGDHVDGVVELCDRVGLELGMSSEDRTALRQAAALHDIGKAAVPDAILSKPGPLDDDEWAFMRRHTIIGERILDGAPALNAASRLVRSSHERFDGTGYPDQLAGADIPLGARVVTVCDAYDAMLHDRPYRRGMSSELALQELVQCAGTQFDPAVVDAFVVALAGSVNRVPDDLRGDVPAPA
jgi:two-component system cell cycle response regulator